MVSLNFLKPMFKSWLKKKVYDAFPDPNYMQERFEWVYNAPITQWRKRLWAVGAVFRNKGCWDWNVSALEFFLRYLNR